MVGVGAGAGEMELGFNGEVGGFYVIKSKKEGKILRKRKRRTAGNWNARRKSWCWDTVSEPRGQRDALELCLHRNAQNEGSQQRASVNHAGNAGRASGPAPCTPVLRAPARPHRGPPGRAEKPHPAVGRLGVEQIRIRLQNLPLNQARLRKGRDCSIQKF